MNSKSFGKEIGLVYQIIMLAKKFGADASFWKALVSCREILIYAIDYIAFHKSEEFIAHAKTPPHEAIRMKLVCFSYTDRVTLEEVYSRVNQFGRLVSDYELDLLTEKLGGLWDEANCPELSYPVVAVSAEDINMHSSYFKALCYGANGGRPTPQQLKMSEVNEKGFAPGTTFVVVPRTRPNIIPAPERMSKQTEVFE